MVIYRNVPLKSQNYFDFRRKTLFFFFISSSTEEGLLFIITVQIIELPQITKPRYIYM